MSSLGPNDVTGGSMYAGTRRQNLICRHQSARVYGPVRCLSLVLMVQVPKAVVEVMQFLVVYAVFEIRVSDLASTLCQDGGKIDLLNENPVSVIGPDARENLQARKDALQVQLPSGTDHETVCILAVLYR